MIAVDNTWAATRRFSVLNCPVGRRGQVFVALLSKTVGFGRWHGCSQRFQVLWLDSMRGCWRFLRYFARRYINGHSDVVMGVIATNSKDLCDRLRFFQVSALVVLFLFTYHFTRRMPLELFQRHLIVIWRTVDWKHCTFFSIDFRLLCVILRQCHSHGTSSKECVFGSAISGSARQGGKSAVSENVRCVSGFICRHTVILDWNRIRNTKLRPNSKVVTEVAKKWLFGGVYSFALSSCLGMITFWLKGNIDNARQVHAFELCGFPSAQQCFSFWKVWKDPSLWRRVWEASNRWWKWELFTADRRFCSSHLAT